MTVREEHYRECDFLIDDSLLKDVREDLTIYRTKIGKGPILLRSFLKGFLLDGLVHYFRQLVKL